MGIKKWLLAKKPEFAFPVTNCHWRRCFCKTFFQNGSNSNREATPYEEPEKDPLRRSRSPTKRALKCTQDIEKLLEGERHIE
jgi:hypothetical protein